MQQSIQTLNLQAWVDAAPADKRYFREAVDLVLSAVGASVNLRSQMVMKGGMLMAIRYNSLRFTRDADFSTRDLYRAGDEIAIVDELRRQIDLANGYSSYDTMCRLQTATLKPKGPIKTFPTLSMSVGYAPRSQPRLLQRLQAGQSPTVVEIDVSFNEAVLDAELLRLGNGHDIQVYSLINLMAEKFRSLLQQPLRKRNRRQDVYDLWLLVNGLGQFSDDETIQLAACIEASCGSKGIAVNRKSLADPMIKQMSGVGFAQLKGDVDTQDLPDFESAYQVIQAFYESLPWTDR